MKISSNAKIWVSLSAFFIVLSVAFHNCSKATVSIRDQDLNKTQGLPPVDVCNGISCSLTPLTDKAAVTTILLTLGGEANSQLVINGATSQLLAESVIRYSSPKDNPRILFVRDQNDNGEDPEDTTYVVSHLLSRYQVTVLQEPSSGLKDSDLTSYDVVWFNNPGAPMGSAVTMQTLINFKGAVIMQGDDLSRGVDFSMENLTGLTYIDNGVVVVCNGNSYTHDNNSDEQFRVQIDPASISGADSAALSFRYGNDIDNTSVSKPGVQVLATAIGGPAECTETRPAIVRYFKD